MNDELPSLPDRSRSASELMRRLASRPALAARVAEILDTLDASLAEGCTADEAEERAIGQLRQLGQEYLQQWAQERNAQLQQSVRQQQPGAIKEGKKNA